MILWCTSEDFFHMVIIIPLCDPRTLLSGSTSMAIILPTNTRMVGGPKLESTSFISKGRSTHCSKLRLIRGVYLSSLKWNSPINNIHESGYKSWFEILSKHAWQWNIWKTYSLWYLRKMWSEEATWAPIPVSTRARISVNCRSRQLPKKKKEEPLPSCSHPEMENY